MFALSRLLAPQPHGTGLGHSIAGLCTFRSSACIGWVYGVLARARLSILNWNYSSGRMNLLLLGLVA